MERDRRRGQTPAVRGTLVPLPVTTRVRTPATAGRTRLQWVFFMTSFLPHHSGLNINCNQNTRALLTRILQTKQQSVLVLLIMKNFGAMCIHWQCKISNRLKWGYNKPKGVLPAQINFKIIRVVSLYQYIPQRTIFLSLCVSRFYCNVHIFINLKIWNIIIESVYFDWCQVSTHQPVELVSG